MTARPQGKGSYRAVGKGFICFGGDAVRNVNILSDNL